MTQENDTDIKDEGVTVTTTPQLSIASSVTAKLAASADASTAFNIKSATSLVALDTYSLGVLGLNTSKKIGATVKYQCGKNGTNFDTSHMNQSYAYTKDMTFAYVNGMSLRGKVVKFANITDPGGSAKLAAGLLCVGTVAAPIVSFGVNEAGKSNNWETSAEKKKNKADKNKSEEEKQKEKEIKDDIGGSPDKETSQTTGFWSSVAGMGASAAATLGAIADIASFSKSGANNGIFMTTDGDIEMNATSGDIPKFCVYSYASGVLAVANAGNNLTGSQSSLEIIDNRKKKYAEFNAINQFLASAGTNTSIVCKADSLAFTTTAASAKIKDDAVELAAGGTGGSSMNIKPASVEISVGGVSVKFADKKLSIAGVVVKK